MTALLADASAFLAAQAFQVAVVFAIVLALDLCFARKGSIGLRAALWAAFFLKLVLPPTLTSPVSIARIFERAPETASFEISSGATSTGSMIPALVLCVWAIGAVLGLACALRRMRAQSAAWSSGARLAPRSAVLELSRLARAAGMARRAPRLCVHDGADGAASVGLLNPVIVIPSALARSNSSLEHVLLHEVCHVRRRDSWRALAWTLARCVYWFHPLVHVAARRAALLRELACDDFAAFHAEGGVSAYRRTLFDLARPLVGATPATTGFAGTGAMITARLERLGRTLPRTRRFDVAPAIAFVLLCVCCIPLGSKSIAVNQLPAFEDMQGCLRKRYLVLAALAERERDQVTASAR